jgi:sigma-B regulation protein RsbU (phosphoserine phosphatase)
MQLRRLYRTIETIASRKFKNEDELLKHVLQEIVQNEEIEITGGRIWKLDARTGSYILSHQIGNVEHIADNFRIKLEEYPLFLELPKIRTILANESNQYLRERGILQYSATGVGDTVQWKSQPVYRYVLAINAPQLDDNLMQTLNIIGSALSSVLRSQKIERKAERLERDYDKAREIQKSILPQHQLKFHKYELYGVSVPDYIVGGDFFDYLHVSGDADRLGVVIADAVSKGLSAAAQALYVSGGLSMGFEFQTKISALMARLNKLINKTFSVDHFVSLFYAELSNDKNGLVLYANCGHNNPILLRANSNTAEFIEATGQILGPFPNERFATESFLMGKGDILLLYTDGVSEATDENGVFYGEDRLVKRLLDFRANTAKDITRLLLEDVQIFNRAGTQSDDKTIVTIKRVE